MRLLIVEDEKDLADVIKKGLEEEGFVADTAHDGSKAMELINSIKYDLIILDLMIPVKSGMEVLRELRQQGNETPILILTAKDSVEDKVEGLDSGANDYLTKPFAFEELKARIRVLLREKSLNNDEQKDKKLIKVGDLVIDTISHEVTRQDQVISLTVKEYAVLEYLTRNRGQVLSRTQIEEHVWDYRFGSNSNIVDVYIRYLREKIDKNFDEKLIETVRGRGYKLRVPHES